MDGWNLDGCDSLLRPGCGQSEIADKKAKVSRTASRMLVSRTECRQAKPMGYCS